MPENDTVAALEAHVVAMTNLLQSDFKSNVGCTKFF